MNTHESKYFKTIIYEVDLPNTTNTAPFWVHRK